MTQFPWHVGPTELFALRGNGGQPFVDFVSALLRAEASVNGLKIDDVDTNIRVNITDGGVDAEVKVPLGGPLAIDAPSCWQFKATAFADVGPASLRKEANKTEARRLIAAGYGYFVCVCDDAPSLKMNELEVALVEIVQTINQDAPKPRLLNCGDLADWANRHPGIVLRFIKPHLGEVLSYERWLRRERADLPHYVSIPSRQAVAEQLRAHVTASGTRHAVLTLAAPAGAGISRLVAESLASVADRGIYVDSAATSVRLVTSLVNQPLASAVVVVDACPLAVRRQLEDLLRAETDRFKLVAIHDHKEEASHVSATLSKLDDDDLQCILNGNFQTIPARHSRAIAHLSDGIPRIAGKLAESYLVDPTRFLDDSASWAHDELRRIVPDPMDLRVLRALALFSRVGYADGKASQLSAVCDLFGLDAREVKRRSARLAKSPGVVLMGPQFLSVRPRLFAKPLFEEAWTELTDSIATQFLARQSDLGYAILCQAADNAHKAARDAIASWAMPWLRELTPKDLARSEVLGRLLPLVDVNPTRVGTMLTELARRASDDEAVDSGEMVDGCSARQRLLWKLGTLLERQETYALAEDALFHLALAENRSVARATQLSPALKIWAASFRLFLSGTEVSYHDRIALLRNRLNSVGDAALPLATVALDSALREHVTRMEGAPLISGAIRPNDWLPPTYGDVWECRNKALDLLGSCLTRPVGREPALRVLVGHGRALLRSGHLKQLKAAVDVIELNETQRIAVLDFVGDFLTFEAKRTDEAGRPPPEYVVDVEAWQKRLQRSDLPGRLFEALSCSSNRNHFGREAQWTQQLEALGAELYASSDTLVQCLESLVCGAHHDGALMALGRAIGKLDDSAAILPVVAAAAHYAKSLLFIRGYIWGLGEFGTQHDAAVVEALNRLEAARPDVALDLNGMNTRLGSTAARALRLVRAGRLPASHLKQVGPAPFQGELLAETLELILGLLAETPEDAVQCAFEMLGFLAWDESSPLPTDERTLAAIWRVLEIGANEASGCSNAWGVMLRRLSDLDLEKGVQVAFAAVRSEQAFGLQEAAEFLRHAVDKDANLVMTHLGELLLETQAAYSLAFGNCTEFVKGLPVETVQQWFNATGISGPRAYAVLLSPPYIDEDGNAAVPTMTEFILETFEHDDVVFSNFLAGQQDCTLRVGDIADQHEKDVAKVEKFLNHRLRRIREWAEWAAESSRGSAKIWRRVDEEAFER